MRILFDQGTPVPLRNLLGSHHKVETAFERGWSTLKNSELLTAAQQDGFEVFVTTDKNLRHQLNPGAWTIAVVVLTTTSWPRIQKAVTAVKHAIDTALPASIQEVEIP